MSTLSTVNRLVITRHCAASREQLFRVWTEPAQLQRWFFAAQPGTTAHADVDVRTGGHYHVSLYGSNGAVIYTVRGMYQEVTPPARLVFSWRWEVPPLDEADTLVTVEFRALGERTEVVVTHECLPDQNPCWDARLDRLEQLWA